jgi:hypothetical protein
MMLAKTVEGAPVGWLLFVAVQAAVVAVSLWAAVELASTWSILPLVFGLWFAWRSLNNPDFVFRRLAAASLFGALGLTALQRALRLDWFLHAESGGVSTALSLMLGEAGDVAIVTLALAGVAFAVCDLVRMRLEQSASATVEAGRSGGVAAYGQYVDAQREEDDRFRLRAEVTVANGGREPVSVTGASVLHHGLLPSVLAAEAVEPRLALDEPPPPGGFQLAPAARRRLAFVYRRRSRLRAWLLRRRPNWLAWFDRLFGAVVLRLDAPQPWAREKVELRLRNSSVAAADDEA